MRRSDHLGTSKSPYPRRCLTAMQEREGYLGLKSGGNAPMIPEANGLK